MKSRDILLEQIVQAVADVLDLPAGDIGIETEGGDVEAWDSFGHVRIILALEAEFEVQLTMAEIESSGSIRGLVEAVESACARKKGAAPQ